MKEGSTNIMNMFAPLNGDIKQQNFLYCEPVGKTDVKADEVADEGFQMTNRQLIILFQTLLNIPLDPKLTNISAFASLIGAVSGRSPESIRKKVTCIDYDDKGCRRDVQNLANLIRPLNSDMADELMRNL